MQGLDAEGGRVIPVVYVQIVMSFFCGALFAVGASQKEEWMIFASVVLGLMAFLLPWMFL